MLDGNPKDNGKQPTHILELAMASLEAGQLGSNMVRVAFKTLETLRPDLERMAADPLVDAGHRKAAESVLGLMARITVLAV